MRSRLPLVILGSVLVVGGGILFAKSMGWVSDENLVCNVILVVCVPTFFISLILSEEGDAKSLFPFW